MIWNDHRYCVEPRIKPNVAARVKTRGLFLGRYIAFGLLYVAAEEEFFHFGAQELAGLGIERVEAIFVDQHGLVGQPLLPRGLGDFGVDALSERARPGSEVEAFGVDAELGAVDGAAHTGFLAGSACNRVRTGAGRPSASSSVWVYQRRWGVSFTALGALASSNSHGSTFKR